MSLKITISQKIFAYFSPQNQTISNCSSIQRQQITVVFDVSQNWALH